MEWEVLFDRFSKAYWFIGMRYCISAGIAFLVFYVLFKEKVPFRKIQDKFPRPIEHRRDLFYSTLTTGIFAIVAVVSFFLLKPFNILYDSLNAKSFTYWGLSRYTHFLHS